MKHWGWTLAVLLLAGTVSAQTLDQPVATIKLDKKSSLIGQKAFRDQLAAVEASGAKLDLDAKRKLLQDMITAKLIEMDMENQGIKASDEDLLKQFRASNPGLTDAQIKAEVEKQSGKTWDEATAALKKQVAGMKYFSQFPETQEVSKVSVSDEEAEKYYQANKTKFAAPEYVRLSHIFFDTKVKPKGTLAELQKKAEEVLKKITSGQATFEEMATSVSEDPGSSKVNGDIGYLPRSLDSAVGQRFLAVFGNDFLERVFALKKGETSGVLTSNSGLHIVRVTQKIDQRFLGLDDEVYPGQGATVRAVIKQNLGQQKVAAAQNKLINTVGDNLKQKATVKTFEQNF